MNFYQPIFRQGESFSPVSSHHLSTVTAQHLQGDTYVLTSLRPHSGLHGCKLLVLRPFLRMWVDLVKKKKKRTGCNGTRLWFKGQQGKRQKQEPSGARWPASLACVIKFQADEKLCLKQKAGGIWGITSEVILRTLSPNAHNCGCTVHLTAPVLTISVDRGWWDGSSVPWELLFSSYRIISPGWFSLCIWADEM